jgi:UDP-N-acetylglucosamine 2-epimerase (non-hydrolysing)
MDKIFFEQLGLPLPKHNLHVGSHPRTKQIAMMMRRLEHAFQIDKPDIVLVEGDTNSVLATALTANRSKIVLGHVEAGLRSHDETMPEEFNRVVTDHLSHYLFAPTSRSKRQLLKEGCNSDKIFVTGNTIVDVVRRNLKQAQKGRILSQLGISANKYFLATVHRQENVENPARLTRIFKGLGMIKSATGLKVICPIHPRTMGKLRVMGIRPSFIELIDPVDYWTFLHLESKARLILTDSGGVQEEACLLQVPCVTLRDNTERPETLDVGSNVLSGTNPMRILAKAKQMMERKRVWMNPFGDGNAGEKIVDIIRHLDEGQL